MGINRSKKRYVIGHLCLTLGAKTRCLALTRRQDPVGTLDKLFSWCKIGGTPENCSLALLVKDPKAIGVVAMEASLAILSLFVNQLRVRSEIEDGTGN
ncbi:MAG: hypothetical protein A2806_03670 [Candidatus Terrybacteria bacterium RIFCSPHIGHO2_01_FULL_48_17]|uniref:Uncharacterized protein n=1 Tax=Candidatus Terrybacteria bacterium RIFCSPHIGHO2_01_FULL_48_17 TaxID=1802362 RepID=A0A1G2PH58_9BACT|nr:MAG: hypothetical protein A2806_03670 [Candidatus Terrybacteria bacterium RIFCSPHIGHO2_01_FULL_48_17]OHA52129.1 MAG: hypothetical protein A3A30_02325 [Candidatus Terrybacteria bacterium RIFCSPLOWO2_01_FULL_48_14]